MRDNTAVMVMPHPAEIEAVKQRQAYAAMHRDPPVASFDIDYTNTIWASKGGYSASDKMLHYEAALIPGATIGLLKLRGEEITKRDWAIKAIALIPIGKVGRLVGKGGALLLKGVGEFVGSPCVLFAVDFMRRIAPTLIKEGGIIRRFEINISRNGLIGTAEQGLSNNGMHQFVEVTKNGQSFIFDNLYSTTKGIPKSEYIKSIEG